jgi:hypothetical protein
MCGDAVTLLLCVFGFAVAKIEFGRIEFGIIDFS